MLERLVAWVLNTYIGEFVENLNTYQLTVGLFQGQVELENLPLKRDALKRLNFPVEVKSGFIGKVQLKVPITRLKSEQWVITLDKLYLVAGPASIADLQKDCDSLKHLDQGAKKAQLKALEESWLLHRNSLDSLPESKTYSWFSYGTSLVTNIVENLLLQINDVHLRYEDDVTIPGCPFACGLTVKSISAQSADSNWLPGFVSCHDGNTMNKLLDIQGLSVYWDAHPNMAGVCSQSQLSEFFQKYFDSSATTDQLHEYILEPVSAQAKLARHRSSVPLRSIEQPRFCIELSLDALPLQLSDFQFRGIIAVGAEIKRHDRRRRYLQWRPQCDVLKNAKTWWKFSIEAHLHHIRDRNKRCQWKYVLNRASCNVRYVRAYRNFLSFGSRGLSRSQRDCIDTQEELLTFDELRLLRELVFNQLLSERRLLISSETNVSDLANDEQQTSPEDNSRHGWSWLQNWFPDWSGWYGGSQTVVDEEAASSFNSEFIDEKRIEQDILDVLNDSEDSSSLLCQDVIFARLTLSLKNGSFCLHKSDFSKHNSDVNKTNAMKCSLLELECSSIKLSFESRPRYNSLKFAVWVEDFYLKDKTASNLIMPVLVQPMNNDSLNTSGTLNISGASNVSGVSATDTDHRELFKLIYEKKPFRVKADHKLVIAVKPLNIVYSSLIIQQLTEFVAFSKFGRDVNAELEFAAAAARNRFENLKKHTQNEVKQTIDDMLEGREETKGNRWLFDFDICAPHITLPENLTNPNSVVVIFDLGHLQFCNLQKQTCAVPDGQNVQKTSNNKNNDDDNDDDDDDDLFVTPLSTPPSEDLDNVSNQEKVAVCTESVSSLSAIDRFYEVYSLHLFDLQVMVGKVKDNWKVAQHKGTGLLHVVDKLSLSLQFERRLIRTYDPNFPKIRLSGNVPSITIHISEQKVFSVMKCIRLLTTASNDGVIKSNTFDEQQQRTRKTLGAAESVSRSRMSLKCVDTRSAECAESVLLTVKFVVDRMSLEIQSRGRSIAELQVVNVTATCVQKPFDTSLGFVVHSLLIVDALQTLGPDFELLVASHQRICLDRASGKIRDSCPNSPDRVPSPSFPSEPCRSSTLTPADVQSKLTSSAEFDMKPSPNTSALDDDKALIKISVDFVELGEAANCADETKLCQANVDFNSLDLIANQQTIVELVSFFQNILPAFKPLDSSESSKSDRPMVHQLPVRSRVRNEVMATFHFLNVLLIRVEKKNLSLSARRVAVLTLCEAKMQVSVTDAFSLEGSLSGLQMLDLTPEASTHQKVLYVGNVYPDDGLQHLDNSSSDTALDAFSLKLRRSVEQSVPTLTVILRMASVRYMHAPHLLSKLSMCLTDFHAFFKRLTATLSSTATELAMGLVINKTADKLSGSFWQVDFGVSRQDVSLQHDQFAYSTTDPLEDCDNYNDDHEVQMDCDTVLQLDIVFESPVIMLPRTTNSSDVLLLRLGRIVVQNVTGDSIELYNSMDTVVMQIHEASMSSLNIEKFDPFCSSQHSFGTPILHSTSVQLQISKTWPGYSSTFLDCLTEAEQPPFTELGLNYVTIVGEVTTPVRVILTKHVYEQILKTLDNITPSDNGAKPEHVNIPQPVNEQDCSKNQQLDPELCAKDSVLRSRHASEVQNARFVISGSFCLPSLTVQMVADLSDGNGDRGLVNLQLECFSVDVVARQGVKVLDIKLQSLILEDLLQGPASSHRWLMVSRGVSASPWQRSASNPTVYMSQSWPTGLSESATPDLPSSLPSSFSDKIENQFVLAGLTSRRQKKDAAKSEKKNVYKSSEDSNKDLLVRVKVKLIDRKAPEFSNFYNSTNRFITVMFNSLETTVNLETWVLLLEFLGVGGKVHNPENFTKAAQQKAATTAPPETENDDIINTEFVINVASLSLVLNKEYYELAMAKVTSVEARVDARDCNMDISGHLGTLILQDTSPHGSLYKERLYTTGDNTINFSIFKYGLPDPDGLREYDVRVRLCMPALWYVHTQRFMQELVAYFQNFNQLQDIIGRSRAASVGKTIADRAYHNARVSLDITADEPVILIPHSSRTRDVLVLNLGKLRVQNTFRRDGSQGTLSESRESERAQRYDAMNQSVYGNLDNDWRSFCQENNLSTAKFGDSAMLDSSTILTSFFTTLGTDGLSSVKSSLVQSEESLLDETRMCSKSLDLSSLPTYSTVAEDYRCLLDVMNIDLIDTEVYSAQCKQKLDSNAENCLSDLTFPSFTVHREHGEILEDKLRLHLQVERNLDVDICRNVPDISVHGKLSSVHLSIDILQYKLVRGVLSHNFGEKLEEFQNNSMSHLKDPKTQSVLSGQVSKGLSICLDLDGVKVELLLARGLSGKRDSSLAKFDFQRSVLQFESRSDGIKDIDLVSHEIVISDTRFSDEPVNVRPNVFTDILKPSADRKDSTALQLELHCRCGTDRDCYKVILNNMRLISVFDWLLVTKEFLASSFEDPFKKDKEIKSKPSTTGLHANNTGSILTRRITAQEQVATQFELCLNLTESEVVVVESPANWDTNAVILKGTAILAYSPRSDRLLSCSLSSLELFSCSLAAEEETALSIIDPMSLSVELNNNSTQLMNRKHHHCTPAIGLLDVGAAENECLPVLEISFHTLDLRLSYNDICLFLAIINSLPQQLIATHHVVPAKNASCISPHLSKLEALGFNSSDCEQALIHARGHLDKAVMWLTKNATPTVDTRPQNRPQLSGFEVKYGSVSICLIDDCQDTDVPLAEVMLTNLYILHKFYPSREGQCRFNLTGDYYNRLLSGWEPFIEKWDCHVTWEEMMNEYGKKLVVGAHGGSSLLNITITSCLLDQLRSTRLKWIGEYSKSQMSGTNNSVMYNSRRRVPFIPFVLRNNTGCRLKFKTVSKTLTTSCIAAEGRKKPETEWRVVESSSELSFIIDEHDKQRHKHTSELKVHQLILKVDGWKQVVPVSVDKVGVYFRQVDADIDDSSKLFEETLSTRIIFEIDIEGSAKKRITIRSSVMLNNQLNDTVEVKLLNVKGSTDKEFRFSIEPLKQVPLPLKFAHASILLRPVNWSLDWCKKPIMWQNAAHSGDILYTENSCSMLGGEPDSYRFCVSTQNLSFPNNSPASSKTGHLPGHVITVAAPFRIESILPVDLNYKVLLPGNVTLTGTVKSGKTACFVVVDINRPIEVQVSLENFPHCRSLVIPPGTTDFRTKVCIHDTEERPLELLMIIKAGLAGSIHLTVGASYWLVNRSGLPLIFKQDGCSLAAGQFEEHEIARSVTPLLFCFAEKEKYDLLTMKLGKSLHGPKTIPQWCQRFKLERGVAVRQVHVSSTESRPDWVYNIGIEVRQGRGRYSETSIVIFKPRYQLVNHSSHKLAYAQRHATHKPGENFLSAPTNSELSYHWPRVDFDNLLCVRLMDKQSCNWSGGFQIDKVDSFHINMRDESNHCLFLRVDIALNGATFVVEFTDADQMPPPYRIDNFAEISVLFYQTKVNIDRLRTWVKPRTSLPYAWDEPTGLPHITLKVASGTDAVYDMNAICDGEKLYYENFIYIGFSHTFRNSGSPALPPLMMGYRSFFESQELVLDVVDNRVMIKKKELGKRSQLWRMSSTGMLQHEGSSTPRDPRVRASALADPSSNCFVLDIKDIALQPNREVPLTLRKIDERRRSTQIWRFTHGRLHLGETNLCVQAKDGVFGLRDGGEAVLGQTPPQINSKNSTNSVELTPEIAVERQKSQAGSGVLCVKVINDGPTRVLRITDITQEQYKSTAVDDWMVIDAAYKPDINLSPEFGSSVEDEETKPATYDIELFIRLPYGIGISLVDNTPEELVYATFRGVTFEYISINDDHIAHADFFSFQVDNQLFDSCKPVLLCVVPSTPQRDTVTDTMPALTFSFHKLPSRKWNANIFKDMCVTIKPVTLQVEEKLVWKLLLFSGFQGNEIDLENSEEVFIGSQRVLPGSSGPCQRHYFGMIRISLSYVSLSMLTSVNLAPDLKTIKNSVGIPLIRFEDAKVELDPFLKLHLFETTDFLIESIRLHYTQELMSQAAKILGSVDFLGNPLGLFSDMAEGVSGLIEGNVGGLLKNVTHGFSNTAAKMVGTLSDSVGLITLDKRHQRQRLQIMNAPSDGGRVEPLRAGLNSLIHGVYGGITSIPNQAYKGARDDGLFGLMSGLGKGLIGTVTKPVAGILDLTSGAASTIRDTSKGFQHRRPARVRRPRCCYGPGGLLTPYQESTAEAQEVLLQKNNYDYSEKLLTVQVLRAGSDDELRVLVSSQTLYFVTRNFDVEILRTSLAKLLNCQSIKRNGRFYVELTIRADFDPMASADIPRKRPEVRCDSQSIAESVSQHIMYAKSMHDEIKQTLRTITAMSS